MTHDSSILVTIKSLFNGDGFKKLDAATKKSAQSAQRATAALGSVTRAMGTLDGAAGKAAGAVGSVFSAIATGGVAGLAVAGITAAFSALSKKIEDAKSKAEEAARKMREAFEKNLSNIKVSFSSDRSRLAADAAQANASEAASAASRNGAFNASVQGIRQNAALASIGKSPEEQKKIALAAEVEIAKKTRAQNIATADASLRSATETAAAEQLKIGSLRDEQKSSAAAYDARIAALQKKIAARENAVTSRARQVSSRNILGQVVGWAADAVRSMFGKPATADGKATAAADKADRAELAKLQEQKKSEQARIAADIRASKLNLTNARTAITTATNAGALARADKSVEIAEKKLAAEIEAQAKAAAKKAKAGEDAVRRMFDERDAAKVEARLARQKEDLDRRIVAAKEQAAAQAAAIAHVQGAVLGGASIPDLVRNDDRAERDAKNSTARARRNLLSKIATANRNGRDASKWQKMLDALDGKNAAQNQVDKLQQQRDALQKKAVNELTAIKNSLQKMGL